MRLKVQLRVQLLISRKPELLLKELWKIQKQRMTLKLGMLPVLSRINSSATKELNKSWANNRTSLLCTRHWVVFCHTLRKHMSQINFLMKKEKLNLSSRKISKVSQEQTTYITSMVVLTISIRKIITKLTISSSNT